MTARSDAVARVALGVAVVAQLVVLYVPNGPAGMPFPHSDKVVHVLVFLVPVALAAWVTGRARVVAAVFAAHAVLSEIVQGTVLPQRSGDPVDVLADLAGVALGVVLAAAAARSRGSGAAPG